jgi:ketosteroid isomerase-like protein
MSQENVDVVRRSWQPTSSGKLPFELWDAHVRIDNMPEFPIKGPYNGHEGLARWWRDLAEVVEDLRFEVKEVIDLGEGRVLSVQRALGRASHTGIEMDVLWASVFTLREGKIVHAQGYWTPEQALEAAGVREMSQENVENLRGGVAPRAGAV